MSLTPSPLLGCAIADALGKPFETKTAGHPALEAWDGESYLPGDYPNLPKPYQDTGELLNRPGVSTDDTQMSRILARSMTNGQFPVREGEDYLGWLRDSYVEWLQGKSFVGAPRGMGGTIRRSLVAHSKGERPENCDPKLPCGTGAAMRSGVIGMLKEPLDTVISLAMADADITHPGHPEARITAAVMAAAVWYAKYDNRISGRRLHKSLLDTFLPRFPHSATVWSLRVVDRFARYGDAWGAGGVSGFPDDGVGVTASALLCATTAASYKVGVVQSILLGGDTDTRAAMVGTILGARFGIGGTEGIPERWVQGLYEADDIMAEDRLLNDLRARAPEGSEGE